MAKKIKLKRSIVVNSQHGEAGSVVETPDHIAMDLINSGKASEVVDAPEKKKPAPPPPEKKKTLSRRSSGRNNK